MLATSVKEQRQISVISDGFETQGQVRSRSVDEFMDELAVRLGKHYGLNDIREAL